MSDIALSIIIVSYNAKDYLLKTLDAVFENSPKESFEVIVVENNSADDSFKATNKLQYPLQMIELDHTVGFSEANNLGAKVAKGKVLLFLNPDTEVQEHALDVLYREVIEHDYGAVSGKLLNADGSIQPQGGALPNLFNVFLWMFFIDDLPLVSRLFFPYQQRTRSFFTKKSKTGWIGGTAFAIRKDLFEELGGWDSNMFLYGEDVEFCLRIAQNKKEVRIVPEAEIVHYQHKSTGGQARSLKGEFAGLLYIWKKYFPAWQYPLVKAILYIGAWLRVLLFGILFRDETRKRAYLEIQKDVSMA